MGKPATKVERTGDFFSISGSQYKATYPDDTTETFWSPPLHTMDRDELIVNAMKLCVEQAAEIERLKKEIGALTARAG